MNDHYPEFHEFLTESVVKPFYLRRLEGLQNIRLQEVLKRKNPYLFKAKNLDTPEQLARGVVDAFLSSQEETVFGDLMEGFAIYVAATLWDGFKSKRVGLDLEFERDGKYHIVEIKSGVNWGNSSQIKRMKGSFKAARVALRPEMDAEIIAVNGCIYGKDARPLKADAQDADQTYFKYAGQEFWAFLSGDENLFREIIKPIDEEAREKDAAFKLAYTAKINELSLSLGLNFLNNGQMDWIKLVEFVSSRDTVKLISAKSSDEVINQAEAEVNS